ncbi:cytochrome C oxidase subunit IV family protein [Virgibacillus sp. NKC19-16]|uniref:cytochrome C oxidase subunit IV family protein n=1 Tax=Virgibacillus salidurans TaxID=2831673 RepID=UPI001F2EDB0F|nr:cytochrome C oxidase subunit IV family protein [Virgibacillus sp. NKC19-16]UJL45856.1 cytochrome C oxidase subunit IV family protein [Virgibacillus sp. NKC19-16]
MEKQSRRYPVKHIIGFLVSIALTIIAAWTALGSDLPDMWIILSILALAVIQAGIQLFMFMHIIESGATHAPWNMMFHAAVVASIVVAGSLFTMSFGFTHDHDDEGGHQEHEQMEQHEDQGGH